MRYYEIHVPKEGIFLASNVRTLRGLPDGTRVYAVVTDRDGSLAETWELPVKNGRVDFKHTEGAQKPKLIS